MTDNAKPLSQAEFEGLMWLNSTHCNLITMIADKTETDVFGNKVPGMTIFRKLAKRGYCFQTEEDPVRFTDDPEEVPFEFTPSMELSDEGRAALKVAMASGLY